MGTFVISPRTSEREVRNYIVGANVSARAKVEKLKLIVRMATRANDEYRRSGVFSERGEKARKERDHFGRLFDIGYDALATSLRCTRRGGSWAWPTDLEDDLNEARRSRNFSSGARGHCFSRS